MKKAKATLSVAEARRLALARAGLLRPEWTDLPKRAAGRGKRAREAALRVVGRFGYLQLDTVSIAGARSHAIVLLARLEGIDPALGEQLLRPGEPLFEYWGHEASWIPLELYPAFEFRRRAFRKHPWWGDVLGAHRDVAERLLARVRDEGPLRSAHLEGEGSSGWWAYKTSRKVAVALWSSGDLAIRERRGFQRTFDLPERVIPEALRAAPLAKEDAVERLLLAALAGHGWATPRTLVATWRLKGADGAGDALERLREQGRAVRCDVVGREGKRTAGWARPQDLELASRLGALRPRSDRGVLLSPFDPVLWDRARVRQLFAFEQVLEIFKPAAARVFGYYVLPVLAGERLVGRVDLAADRRAGRLKVLATHLEEPRAEAGEATRRALERYAAGLGLELETRPPKQQAREERPARAARRG